MTEKIWRKFSLRKSKKLYARSQSEPDGAGKSVTYALDVENGGKIEPFAYTYDPTISWELLKSRQTVKSSKALKLNSPMRDDQVRFVSLSCTHGLHRKIHYEIPDGDILIIAGDFTTCGHPREIEDFNNFLGTLPHRHKIVIAGNHELTFDPSLQRSNYLGLDNDFCYDILMSGFERVFKQLEPGTKGSGLRSTIMKTLQDEGVSDVRQLLTNCIYLEDCAIELYGIKIYGTPWQPAFDNWAFNLPRGQSCLDKWALIPPLVDVLITHTPPIGHGDLTRTGVRAGCVELLMSVRKRIRPKFHIFGHIHEGYGVTTDGYTKFINCCVCDCHMRPVNMPIIFDLPLPPGFQK